MSLFHFRGKRHASNAERAKMERLEKAEGDLRVLQDRADKAINTLNARATRNHWRESIENMIQGVPQ